MKGEKKSWKKGLVGIGIGVLVAVLGVGIWQKKMYRPMGKPEL